MARKAGGGPGEAASAAPLNAMTVDVEDWFQVQAFAGTIPRDSWDTLERRVEASTDRFLAMFAEAGVRATFFTLGWVADRHPALVRRIVAAGHELASHGYAHRLAHEQTEAEFRADVGRARRLLEDVGGVPVRGYRAPTFSINTRNPWAFGVLADEGHTYSSSTFPIRHDLYGMPDAPRVPHRVAGGRLLEIPMTTVRVGGRNLPCSGGGYFRLVPYALFRAGLARVNGHEGARGLFYTHPWEIDPGQPRVPGAPAMARFRHRVGMASAAARIGRLLRDFAWDRMDSVFAPELHAPELHAPELHAPELHTTVPDAT
jgi:polysaccharide deacetylase family protein (PEP-CTERM system associated)